MEAEKNNKSQNVIGTIMYMVILFALLYIFFLSFFNQQVGASTQNITSNVDYIETEDILRCVGYQPIFDINGNKQYEVYFRSYNYNTVFTCILSEKEVEETQNVQKDAKYECNLKIVYLSDFFETLIPKISNITEEYKKSVILKGMTNTNYKDFFRIYDADFMYSDKLKLLSIDENIEDMIQSASKQVKVDRVPVIMTNDTDIEINRDKEVRVIE